MCLFPVGGLLVLFYGNPSASKLGHLLSFSAGVMLYISFMDLLPEAAEGIGFVKANIAVRRSSIILTGSSPKKSSKEGPLEGPLGAKPPLASFWRLLAQVLTFSPLQFFGGMIFFAVLSKLIPEDLGGHDHDHGVEKKSAVAAPTSPKSPSRSSRSRSSRRDSQAPGENGNGTATHEDKAKKTSKEDRELKRVGLVTALGISIHNFPEGIAVYLACLKGMDVGLPIALAIAAHNIPEGMAVASPIYHSTGSKWEAFKFSMVSGICEPLAALIFSMFFSSYMNDDTIQMLLAAVAGIMVLVSLKELLPTALKYISADSAMISNALGMAFIGLSIYFLHAQGGHDHSHGGHSHDHAHAHDHAHTHTHTHTHAGHDHAHHDHVHAH